MKLERITHLKISLIGPGLLKCNTGLARVWSVAGKDSIWISRGESQTLPRRKLCWWGELSVVQRAHMTRFMGKSVSGAGIFHTVQEGRRPGVVSASPLQTPAQTPLTIPYPTHQAVIPGKWGSAADLGGLLLRMAWEQQLLSVCLQGVDSHGLRELGERSRGSDAVEIRPQRPSLITKGPPAEESLLLLASQRKCLLLLQATSGPLCGEKAPEALHLRLLDKIHDAQLNLNFG